MQLVCAIEHVGVRIDDSGNDGLPVQIDHLGPAIASFQDGRIRADGLDARSTDGQSRGPRGLGVARIDVTVNEQRIAGERRTLPSQRDQHRANTCLPSQLHVRLPLD